MQRRAWLVLLACLLAVGCARGSDGPDSGPPDSGSIGSMDAGQDLDARPIEPDSGPDEPDAGPGEADAGDAGAPTCGALGLSCCAPESSCRSGTACQDGTCCAVPGGASCGGAEDCCGDGQCEGGSCCAPQDGACRSSADCCSDLLCADGTCLMPFTSCGREGEACCEDDACRRGLTCAGGSCVPCGGTDQICCKPPRQCTEGGVCDGGRCAAPDPSCGGEGQPCCADERCTGSLSCIAGVCDNPATACGYASCGECTLYYPCGWCGDTGACMVGTEAGPDSGSCSDWSWEGIQCDDPCADASDCGACTDRADCGWCNDTGSCELGTSGGPSGGSCSDWDWGGLECDGGAGCADFTDCESCTLYYPCGWCGDTGGCTAGTSSGPDVGSCSWTWTQSECGADPCAGLSECGSCAAEPGCGWCESTSSCVSGDSSGPTSGSCGDWEFGSGACTCGVVRDSCSVDGDCCDGSCRRGVTFPIRCCQEAGDACPGGGPDCCGFMDCVSGFCACRAAGRGCLEDADCCGQMQCVEVDVDVSLCQCRSAGQSCAGGDCCESLTCVGGFCE